MGAGVSLPSGFPLVGELTEKVLTAGRKGSVEGDVCDFLRLLHEEQTQFLAKHVDPEPQLNYEHLYHLCDQIEKCLKGDLDNAAVGPFIDRL